MALLSSLRHLLCALAFLSPLVAASPDGLYVPDKLPDGVYEISPAIGSQGKHIIVTQYDINALMNQNVTAKDNDDRYAPPITLSNCPYQRETDLDYNHMEIAREMLGSWCEMYSPHVGTIALAVYGNATWYVCEWNNPPIEGDAVRSCSRWELGFAAKKIDQWCGKQKNGFIQMLDWGMDYGRSERGAPICPMLEFHDRRMDLTLASKQRHRIRPLRGSGLEKGDVKIWGKDAAGKNGLKNIGETSWRGPKNGDLGSSGGRGPSDRPWIEKQGWVGPLRGEDDGRIS